VGSDARRAEAAFRPPRPGRTWGARLGTPTVALLAGFLVRMIGIGSRPLWYDEAFAALYARLDPVRIVYGTVTPVAGARAADVHPLLYYFLLHVWMRLAGYAPLALRFFSVVCGMLTVALLGRLAAHFLRRPTGALVTWLAALNPFHVAYSQEARMYALLGLAAVTATWGLLRALEEGRVRWWLLYAGAAAWTLYAHNLGAFMLLALHVLALFRRPWRRRLPTLALADAGMLVLFSPWLVGVLPGQLAFVGRGYWVARPGPEVLLRAFLFPTLTFYEPAPAWLLGLGLFVGLALHALGIPLMWRARSRAGWFLWLAWLPVLALYAVSQLRPVYLERALLPAALLALLPAGWLLGGSAEGRRAARGAALPRPLRLGLGALLVAACAGSLGVHYTYVGFPRPPFERVAASLRAQLLPGDVVVHTSKLTYLPLLYYDPALPSRFLADPPGSAQDTLALPTQQALGISASATITAAAQGAQRVWLVYFPRESEELRALGVAEHPVLAWLDAHMATVGEQRFADLAVVLYERTAPAEDGP